MVGLELIVSFTIDGRGVPQPRVSDGKHGDHKIMAPAGHAIRGWRAKVKQAARVAMGVRPPVTGPVKFRAMFIYARPKRLCQPRSKVLLASDERYEDEFVWHDVDPDWDNVGKAVGDSLKMVVWVDDCQVADGRVQKRYGAPGEAPRVEVRAWRLL